MKKEDLRIGNIINFSFGGISDISPFGFANVAFMTKYDDDELFGKCFKPVPLTEEWLINFGFKKIGWTKSCIKDRGINGDKNKTYHKLIKRSSDALIVNGNEYSYVKNKYKNFVNGKVEYVHQLQNLHFALTGKELTI
jgi:hypothetical protein